MVKLCMQATERLVWYEERVNSLLKYEFENGVKNCKEESGISVMERIKHNSSGKHIPTSTPLLHSNSFKRKLIDNNFISKIRVGIEINIPRN